MLAAAHAHITAFNAHDSAKAVSADLPDVVVMFHGAPNDAGVAADLATTKAEVADPLAHVELSAESLDVGGSDFAVYHSSYDYTLTDPKTKAAAHERGNYLIGFKRQADGALKIAWQIISDTPASKLSALRRKPDTDFRYGVRALTNGRTESGLWHAPGERPCRRLANVRSWRGADPGP